MNSRMIITVVRSSGHIQDMNGPVNNGSALNQDFGAVFNMAVSTLQGITPSIDITAQVRLDAFRTLFYPLRRLLTVSQREDFPCRRLGEKWPLGRPIRRQIP